MKSSLGIGRSGVSREWPGAIKPRQLMEPHSLKGSRRVPAGPQKPVAGGAPARARSWVRAGCFPIGTHQ